EWEVGQDFTCLTPPLPRLWVEYRRPSRIVSDVHGVSSAKTFPYAVGFLCEVIDGHDLHTMMSNPNTLASMRAMMANAVRWSIPPERQAIILDRVRSRSSERGCRLDWSEVDELASVEEKEWLRSVVMLYHLEPAQINMYRESIRTAFP